MWRIIYLLNYFYLYIFTNSDIKVTSLQIPSILCPWVLLLAWQNPDHKWTHAFILSVLTPSSLTTGWTNVLSPKWSLTQSSHPTLFCSHFGLFKPVIALFVFPLGITSFFLNQWLCLILYWKKNCELLLEKIVSLAKNSLIFSPSSLLASASLIGFPLV